jgi:uncharacterized membrane protein
MRMPDFKKDERGAVAIVAALALVGMLGMIALAVDLGRLVSARHKLQIVIDNAVIAAASAPAGSQPSQIARSFVEAHSIAGMRIGDVQVVPSPDGKALTATATGSLPSAMTGTIGQKILSLRVTSTASRPDRRLSAR